MLSVLRHKGNARFQKNTQNCFFDFKCRLLSKKDFGVTPVLSKSD